MLCLMQDASKKNTHKVEKKSRKVRHGWDGLNAKGLVFEFKSLFRTWIKIILAKTS